MDPLFPRGVKSFLSPACPPPCPPPCPPLRPPPRQFFLRKSNTHAYTLDWCAFALDGVKNKRPDGKGVSRSRKEEN